MNYILLLITFGFITAGTIPATRPVADGSAIKVVITGGANAGTYNMASDKTTCSRNATGANSFGNQYSTRAKTGLTSVQLIISDAKKAAAGGSADCYLMVRFGDIMNGTTYEFGKMPKLFGGSDAGGKGMATLTGSGNSTTSTIEGTTKAGVKLQVTIQCQSVLDLGK